MGTYTAQKVVSTLIEKKVVSFPFNMINLNTKIILPNKAALDFFASHNLSDRDFDTYLKYNSKTLKESKQRETYLVCLNDILLYNKDEEVKNYIKELIKRTKERKTNKEHVPTFSQVINYGSGCSINDNVINFNPKLNEDKRLKKQAFGKRHKKPIQYLRGRSIYEDPIDNPIRWYIDNNDISRVLWEYRDKCIKTAEKGDRFSSDIDELTLNGIYFVSFTNNRYQIEMSLYQKMTLELKGEFLIRILLLQLKSEQ